MSTQIIFLKIFLLLIIQFFKKCWKYLIDDLKIEFKEKNFIYSWLFSLICLFVIPKIVQANPSDYCEERKECLENHDFITPSTK